MKDLSGMQSQAPAPETVSKPSMAGTAKMPPVSSAAAGVGGPGLGMAGSVVDKSIVVPAALVMKLIGPAGATIKKLAADSGAQINLDTGAQPGGGKAIVITAADPAVREKAKAAVQQWVRENQAGGIGASPSFPPPTGQQSAAMGATGRQDTSSGYSKASPAGLRPPLG